LISAVNESRPELAGAALCWGAAIESARSASVTSLTGCPAVTTPVDGDAVDAGMEAPEDVVGATNGATTAAAAAAAAAAAPTDDVAGMADDAAPLGIAPFRRWC